MSQELSPSELQPYLQKHGLMEPDQDVVKRKVGDSKLGYVIRIRIDGTDSYILKTYWDADYDRVIDLSRLEREIAASENLLDMIDEGDIDSLNVAENAVFDEPNFTLINEIDHKKAFPFQSMLRDYRVADKELNYDIIRNAGKALGTLQNASKGRDLQEHRFPRDHRSDAMRMDKHHLKVAQSYPYFGEPALKSRNNLLSSEDVLVHGNFTPENLLVNDNGDIMTIDFEFTHMGHPAFDLAYFVNYLYCSECAHAYKYDLDFRSIFEFWEAYSEHADMDGEVRQALFMEMPIRILTRIDGVHPYNWIPRGMRESLRSISKQIITHDVHTFDKLFEISEKTFDLYDAMPSLDLE